MVVGVALAGDAFGRGPRALSGKFREWRADRNDAGARVERVVDSGTDAGEFVGALSGGRGVGGRAGGAAVQQGGGARAGESRGQVYSGDGRSIGGRELHIINAVSQYTI